MAMITAKVFQHGKRQAVLLPKMFHFSGEEVRIEKRGEDVILSPMPASKFRTFAEIARYLAEKFPDAGDFPEPVPWPLGHHGRAKARPKNVRKVGRVGTKATPA